MFGNKLGGNVSLVCPTHQKTKDQLVHICTEPKCNGQPLLCGKCLKEDTHKEHDTVSFYEFAQKIDGLRYDETLKQQADLSELKIKEVKAEYLSFCVLIKETVLKEIGEIQTIITNYFDQNFHKKLQNFNNSSIRPFQIKESSTVDEISDEVKQQRFTYSQEKEKKTKQINRLQKVLEILEQEKSVGKPAFLSYYQTTCKTMYNIKQLFSEKKMIQSKDFCSKCKRKFDAVSWHCSEKGRCMKSVPIYWGFFADESENTQRKYCLICHSFKPPGCIHCSTCNKCELELDSKF